ncbi:MAG: cupin domain-containing protein [Candidatus Hodarchaeales archaeon]|jgi:quercetin dioxygenase-like cupin family protein
MSFINLKDVYEKEVVPGFKGKFVHSVNVTVAYWSITKGSLLPEHDHPHEQVTNVIKGELELSIGEGIKILKAGEVAVIPSNAKHHGKAISDCYVIDVFNPVREDYKFVPE